MASGVETRKLVPFAAMACAALMAYDIAGRSARDTLFLQYIGTKALPATTVGAALVAIAVGTYVSRRMLLMDPARYLSWAMAASAAACLIEAWLIQLLPRTVAAVVYMHFTALNGLFMAGFWMVVFERFDPRSAKRSGTVISAVGTVGGVIGGLLGLVIAATGRINSTLLVLAGINAIAAAGLFGLRAKSPADALVRDRMPTAMMTPSAMQHPALTILRRSRYVRVLVGLIVLCAIAETMIDYVFMTRAGTNFIRGPALLRLFSVFYTGAALLTLGPLLFLSDRMLARFGAAITGATLPGALVVTGAAALAAPGLVTSGVARATEITLRNSTFRGAFDLLFNNIRPAEKRQVKTMVEVTALRTGRIIAAVLTQLVILTLPGTTLPALVVLMMLAATGALLLFRGMDRASLEVLEGNLVARASRDTRLPHERFATQMFPVAAGGDTMGTGFFNRVTAGENEDDSGAGADPYAARRAELLSGEAPRIVAALKAPLHESLADAVIPLLAREDVYRTALRALQYAPHQAIPAIRAAMLDPSIDLVVRRRLPFALATHHRPEARDALVDGLLHERFEVRSRCGVALSHLVEADASLAPPRDVVLACALKEVEVGHGVWERRALIPLLPEEKSSTVLGEVLQERADQSLAHLFTLLSFILPAAPLRAAFRTLESKDAHLRGTALDYLEQVLPEEVRRGLWDVLEEPERPRKERKEDADAAPLTPEEELARAVKGRLSIEFRIDMLRGTDKPSDGGN